MKKRISSLILLLTVLMSVCVFMPANIQADDSASDIFGANGKIPRLPEGARLHYIVFKDGYQNNLAMTSFDFLEGEDNYIICDDSHMLYFSDESRLRNCTIYYYDSSKNEWVAEMTGFGMGFNVMEIYRSSLDVYVGKKRYLTGEDYWEIPAEKTSFGSEVSDWAREEVEEAFDEKLVPDVLKGKDLTQKIDRAEFAAIAVALYKKLTGNDIMETDNPFNDINENPCRDDILKAYNLGITAGTTTTTFEPNVSITREQMATILARTYKKSIYEDWSLATDSDYPLNSWGFPKFDDDDEISDYAKEAVYFMAYYDVIKGIGDNKFGPKNDETLGEMYGYATREQAVIIALRCRKLL